MLSVFFLAPIFYALLIGFTYKSGKVENIPTQYKQEMINCLKKVKRMGLNRNRGLGRCVIELVGENK